MSGCHGASQPADAKSTELGGFLLIQGTREQIDALRTDRGFEAWVTQIQLVADGVGIVDAWVGDGNDCRATQSAVIPGSPTVGPPRTDRGQPGQPLKLAVVPRLFTIGPTGDCLREKTA